MRALFLLSLCVFSSCVFAQLPTYTTGACTVVGNDYAFNGKIGYCSDESPPADDPYGKREVKDWIGNAWSCQIDSNIDQGYGRVNVTLNGKTYEVCNTMNCNSADAESDVTGWLTQNYQGKPERCYQQNGNPNIVFIDEDGICSFQGTYNEATNTCSCNEPYIGDDCSQVAAVSPTPTSNSATSIAPALVLLFLFVVLFML